jgi:hypothetical protein
MVYDIKLWQNLRRKGRPTQRAADWLRLAALGSPAADAFRWAAQLAKAKVAHD